MTTTSPTTAHTVELTGLRAERYTPAWLAAVGALRILTNFEFDPPPRLAWHAHGHAYHPQLHMPADTDYLELLTAQLHHDQQCQSVSPDAEHPVPSHTSDGVGGDPLRHHHPDRHRQRLTHPNRAVQQWMRALATDAATADRDGQRATPSQFLLGGRSGKGGRAADLTTAINRTSPDTVAALLIDGPHTHRVNGCGLSWDLDASVEAAEHPNVEIGDPANPAATWLGFHALPLLPVTHTINPTTNQPQARTTGWHRYRDTNILALPVWRHPLTPTAIHALVRHSLLTPARDMPLPATQAQLDRLGIHAVLHITIIRRPQQQQQRPYLSRPTIAQPRAGQ